MNKLSLFAAALLAAAACAPKASVKNSSANAVKQSGLADDDQEADVRNSILHEISDVKEVRFQYNSDMLTSDARAALKGNAEWLAAHPGVKIQVAGHCDQRGTVEYNLALGQRRAAAVRHYYVMLGVPAARVATISYGKERPVCQEAEESCWARNRRAQTLVAFPQDLSKATTVK